MTGSRVVPYRSDNSDPIERVSSSTAGPHKMASSSADGDAPVSDSGLYFEGEIVLAYHSPRMTRIYEAQVQKVELRNNEWKYFVHYLDWNEVSWDEWVGVDRLLKLNSENIMKQKSLNKKQDDNITKSGRSTQMKPKTFAEAEGKKRKNDSAEVRQDAVHQKFSGMDAETNKKGSRRIWTIEEEDALLSILEDLVAKGHRLDDGTFRKGTLIQVEKALRNFFPEAGLKLNPHIESKMKILKRQFRIVHDMVNRTGFKWNDEKKCVMVDSEKTWKAYLQHHKEADGWRGKFFPLYDRLGNILKADCAVGDRSQTPADIFEEMNCIVDNTTYCGMEDDTNQRSIDQFTSTKQTYQSRSTKRKRRRQDDTGCSNYINETCERRVRRRWTEEEEDALLGILEDLVSKGHRNEHGIFKHGTCILIEDALGKLCPTSGLKASPHVESKIKKLKSQCSIVCDMLNADGFSWNNEMKCVEVDSETWKAYVQHHKEADKWRGKFFPLFDRLIHIFDLDLPNVNTIRTPVKMVEKMNCAEVNTTDSGTEKDTCPRSVDQVSTTKKTNQCQGREDDMGGSPQCNVINRSKRRRTWTREEENALLGILENLVAKGHRFHNKTFRSGTLTLIENALCQICPASGLKAYPHVESKLKKLKRIYSIVCDILNSGFGWNERTKCVVVECEEAWKDFVQRHKEAGKWRYKHYPHYDRLAKIFGVDCTHVKAYEAPIEAAEAINSDEAESSDLGIEENTNSRSIDQTSTNKQADRSHSPQRNSRRLDGDVGVVLNKFMGMMQTSKEQMRVLIENMQSKGNIESLQSKDINESQQSKDKNESQQSKGNDDSQQSTENKTGQLRSELIKLGLSISDRVKALRLLMADTWNADFFLTLDDEEKLEFVKQLIDESSNK